MATYQADPWAALADPTRRDILERLLERPRPVGELAEDLPVSRPAVSQHLKVLKDAGLVVGEIEGLRTCYWASRKRLAELYALAGDLLVDAVGIDGNECDSDH